ncbi:phage head morphogenesis protein [Desertihabitans brevis]|uniref:Phage head morphogenesis protein n=1 Tax=Desertihabitans brevis TaxID=2268447 RepID=A0A367YR23_9ACTN|nr:phage minor head protein [Desertihabitans brevis]RCK68274.1 phage head morphogenesis protein [Desertihabitans brevis]
MAVTDRTLQALRELRIELDSTVDAATRDLAANWSRAWDELADEFAAVIDALIAAGADGDWPTRRQVTRARRVAAALQHASDAISDLTQAAGVTVTEALPMLTGAAEEWVETIARTQLPAGVTVSWDRVDRAALDAIVRRSTEQITSRLLPLSDEAAGAMRSSLIRGVAVGDNPRTAARRMLQRVEGDFNGGRRRAETIARTEMLDAHRESARQARMANSDLLAGWTWQATLDARTCPACISRHGTEHPAGTPGPEGHPQCRCTSLPVTKSWRDLGIALDEPDDVEQPTGREWFDAQPEAVQRQIMGPERLRRLQAGDLAWSDLAVRRTNADWRPSWQVAPLGPGTTTRRQRAA